MAKIIFTLAINELKILLREKTFLLLLAIFMAMTFFSVYIGWSTRTTIFAIYRESLSILREAGMSKFPPDPVLNVPALAVFNNMIVYIFLIGALLAIVIGHRSFIRERKSGVLPLIFSRPVGRKEYIGGKMAGIMLALAFVLAITFAVSALSSLFIPGLRMSFAEIEKLFFFYGVSFLYLFVFSLLGLLFSIFMRAESMALLVPIIIWVALSFVLPELTTGQNPVALLNPVNIAQSPQAQGQFFVWARNLLAPFSISQHFTVLSLHLLGIEKQTEASGGLSVLSVNFQHLILLMISIFIFVAANIFALSKYSITRDKIV